MKDDADQEVDLLIAGAGPAGMAAALVASLEGLDVLLCEKSDQVGGTGSTSAGTLWIPGNSQSRVAGFNDSGEQADRYLSALIGETTNSGLRNAYLRDWTISDRLPIRSIRLAVSSLRKTPGLSEQYARRGYFGPCNSARAVRRTPARRRILAHSPADTGIHVVRRHDDRQSRYFPVDRPLSTRSQILFIRRNCLHVTWRIA